MVCELRQPPAHTEHREHGTGTGIPPRPPALVALSVACVEQLRVDVVQIGRRHDEVGELGAQRAVRIPIAHPAGAPVDRHDALDARPGVQLGTRGLGQTHEALHDGREAAHRIQHALVDVEVAHEVVHARHPQGPPRNTAG
ncbi:hypothetical protein GCM10025869_00090 [Homoserinibacter gongjuensis]|uniref:Uncharacterized protein n=1 Tax=Homoserinibacter gongjuensis TaxID=1162968 RepID=A0ABQ6JQD6_9MICO|nr:hypothetical protein GCM10025869_00090 [Homoserinibacter gongjuensis]